MKTLHEIYSLLEIGNVIRTTRKVMGLSQSRLALLTGLSPLSIQRIEKGEKGLTIDIFLKLMAVLDINLTLQLPSSFSRSTTSSTLCL